MGILVLCAIETKDIGYFRVLPLSLYSCLFHGSALLFFIKKVKRAFDFGNPLLNEMKVDEGSLQGCMAEKSFDSIQVSALVEQVGSKGVAEGVNTALFGYAGFFLALLKALRTALVHMGM
jgi:hypothetical protein